MLRYVIHKALLSSFDGSFAVLLCLSKSRENASAFFFVVIFPVRAAWRREEAADKCNLMLGGSRQDQPVIFWSASSSK
jgi:hypothetical protein